MTLANSFIICYLKLNRYNIKLFVVLNVVPVLNSVALYSYSCWPVGLWHKPSFMVTSLKGRFFPGGCLSFPLSLSCSTAGVGTVSHQRPNLQKCPTLNNISSHGCFCLGHKICNMLILYMITYNICPHYQSLFIHPPTQGPWPSQVTLLLVQNVFPSQTSWLELLCWYSPWKHLASATWCCWCFFYN